MFLMQLQCVNNSGIKIQVRILINFNNFVNFNNTVWILYTKLASFPCLHPAFVACSTRSLALRKTHGAGEVWKRG